MATKSGLAVANKAPVYAGDGRPEGAAAAGIMCQ